MPWKEPGEKPREPKGREPWGQGGRSGGGPDLEAWLRKLRRGLGPFGHGPLAALALIVVLLVLWFVFGGISVVGERQVGVLLRFGRLQGVLQPGVHMHLPTPIDRVDIVDMGRARTLSDESRLLTSDGQLALVDYDVQYKVTDAGKFLFASRDAEETARNAATVAVRAVVGTHSLQGLLDRSDDKLAASVRAQVTAALQRADIGIAVTGVGIRNVGVPTEVKEAFDGIAKAHEDAKASQATARADVARGQVDARARANALKADAASYRDQSVAEAKADVARFAQVLTQYQAAPQVTRHRLWLAAMREVLSHNRVVINTGSGSVIVQFPPLPAATPAPGKATPATSGAPASAASAPASASTTIPVTSGPGVRGAGA